VEEGHCFRGSGRIGRELPPEYGREHLVLGAEVMRQRAATGSSCRASHRCVGSVAVGLARYCPVKLVIGP
jgi:hypothetical protein